MQWASGRIAVRHMYIVQGRWLTWYAHLTIPAGTEKYPYIQHLLEFEQRVGGAPVPAWLQKVTTPLILREWIIELRDHPDAEFRSYILNGIKNGFRIGFNRAATCKSASFNMRSAIENAEVVQEYLKKEVSLGCILGPVPPERVPAGAQLSPVGVIPKSSQLGKWRLIVDLSSPDAKSVNAGIEPELCSLQYLRLDEVIAEVSRIGRGAQLAKLDIESAYRKIPVHPGDRQLLAVHMGRAKHSLTLWLEISTKDLLSGGRCIAVVYATTRSVVGGTLPRRLHHYGPSEYSRVPEELRPDADAMQEAGCPGCPSKV